MSATGEDGAYQCDAKRSQAGPNNKDGSHIAAEVKEDMCRRKCGNKRREVLACFIVREIYMKQSTSRDYESNGREAANVGPYSPCEVREDLLSSAIIEAKVQMGYLAASLNPDTGQHDVLE